MPILRVRDKNGKIVNIPAIKGDPGKSGYSVIVGSYVGDGLNISTYIDLGSPDVKVVLLETTSASKPLLIVGTWTTMIDGRNSANLISGTVMGKGSNMFLALHNAEDVKQSGVTYHYIAFVEEG